MIGLLLYGHCIHSNWVVATSHPQASFPACQGVTHQGRGVSGKRLFGVALKLVELSGVGCFRQTPPAYTRTAQFSAPIENPYGWPSLHWVQAHAQSAKVWTEQQTQPRHNNTALDIGNSERLQEAKVSNLPSSTCMCVCAIFMQILARALHNNKWLLFAVNLALKYDKQFSLAIHTPPGRCILYFCEQQRCTAAPAYPMSAANTKIEISWCLCSVESGCFCARHCSSEYPLQTSKRRLNRLRNCNFVGFWHSLMQKQFYPWNFWCV